MDFKLSAEEEKRRKEFFDGCKELSKERPANFIQGLEADFEKANQPYVTRCRKEFAKRGWLRLGWPAEYGGVGSHMDRVFFGEARGYYGLPGVDIFGIEMLAPTLIAMGSKEVKDRFLPPIGRGEVLWCELYSEPNAGSDLAALTATAIRKGDEYVINGQKTWTTNAHNADWGFGLFRTDPQGRKRRNISFLLMDMKTPGITVNPLEYFNRAHLYNEVFFDDVHIPADQIVGKENDGWTVSQTLVNFERSNVLAVSAVRRMLETLVEYCNETKVGGKPLAQDPIIRDKLAEVATEIEASRTLAYYIADQQNRNQVAALFESSAAKVFIGDLYERLGAIGTDILGSYGQVKASRWARQGGLWESLYQTAFVLTISMGTNEIQKNIIAWYGLGMPRPLSPVSIEKALAAAQAAK